jgi:hypothetical protein
VSHSFLDLCSLLPSLSTLFVHTTLGTLLGQNQAEADVIIDVRTINAAAQKRKGQMIDKKPIPSHYRILET